jgi:hypothetical protein
MAVRHNPNSIPFGGYFLRDGPLIPTGQSEPATGAVVVTVTVTFCGPLPVTTSGLGATLHVVNAGFPAQLNVMFCVNPAPGVTASV